MFKKIVGLGFSAKGKNKKAVKQYITQLVESGAGEFFTGYNPSYWSDKFGFEVSPNGRFAEHEQITDFETLKEIVGEVHEHNLEVFVNLNAWYYTDETFPLIQKMVEEFKEIGVDGIICGSISILEYLKEIEYPGKINISTILAAYNSETIKFYLDNYKINKVILSREVTLKEIKELVQEFPEVLFEVFGEGDFCRYNNGLCFAEHKYGAKDICTVVVNDLVIKKKFRADFKEIMLDENLSNEEKVKKLDDSYEDIFEKASRILQEIDMGFGDITALEKELIQIIKQSKSRVDLYFDALQSLDSKRNKDILEYFRALKYLDCDEFNELKDEIENSIQTGLQYLTQKTKQIGGKAKLRAFELANFYAKGDSLNLYSYLFFENLNIDTVKFPTRGRNYSEKLAIIEQVLQEGQVNEKYIDRGISLERTHYDLSYLFGEKLWFRKMLRKIK